MILWEMHQEQALSLVIPVVLWRQLFEVHMNLLQKKNLQNSF